MIIYSDLKMSYLWLVVHVWICKKQKQIVIINENKYLQMVLF